MNNMPPLKTAPIMVGACPDCGEHIEIDARRCKSCCELLPDGWARGRPTVARPPRLRVRFRESLRP